MNSRQRWNCLPPFLLMSERIAAHNVERGKTCRASKQMSYDRVLQLLASIQIPKTPWQYYKQVWCISASTATCHNQMITKDSQYNRSTYPLVLRMTPVGSLWPSSSASPPFIILLTATEQTVDASLVLFAMTEFWKRDLGKIEAIGTSGIRLTRLPGHVLSRIIIARSIPEHQT